MDPSNQYPSAATITVHVWDAQQQPVDGIPVMFQIAPQWQEHVVLTPQNITTRNGIAKATFEAKDQTGFCYVTVQVDKRTEQIMFNVEERSPWAGGPVFR